MRKEGLGSVARTGESRQWVREAGGIGTSTSFDQARICFLQIQTGFTASMFTLKSIPNSIPGSRSALRAEIWH